MSNQVNPAGRAYDDCITDFEHFALAITRADQIFSKRIDPAALELAVGGEANTFQVDVLHHWQCHIVRDHASASSVVT